MVRGDMGAAMGTRKVWKVRVTDPYAIPRSLTKIIDYPEDQALNHFDLPIIALDRERLKRELDEYLSVNPDAKALHFTGVSCTLTTGVQIR